MNKDNTPKTRRKNRKLCLTCNKPVNLYKSIFCSQKCFKDYNTNKAYEAIEKFGCAQTTTNTLIIKKYLQLKFGDKCQICQLETWLEKPIVKILDHIDGNSDNWKLNNLRLICSNCDSQLPTYKGRNKGNGRHKRKQRYKDGLSY